jgi:hypothetical protein
MEGRSQAGSPALSLLSPNLSGASAAGGQAEVESVATHDGGRPNSTGKVEYVG